MGIDAELLIKSSHRMVLRGPHMSCGMNTDDGHGIGDDKKPESVRVQISIPHSIYYLSPHFTGFTFLISPFSFLSTLHLYPFSLSTPANSQRRPSAFSITHDQSSRADRIGDDQSGLTIDAHHSVDQPPCPGPPFPISPSTMLRKEGSAGSSSTLIYVLTVAALAITPIHAQLANTIKYVGLSGVSAQQMFLGTMGKVYIVDKTGEPDFKSHTIGC